MKRQMQRGLSVLLALVLILGMIPSAAFATESDAASQLAGKTVSILGDSISTYTGVSNNTSYNSTIGGNAIYYNEGTLGVYLHDTWWQQVIDALGMELCVNNSWSGSRISWDGSGPAAYKDRCVQLHNNEGEEPDYIWVYLGTNDQTSSGLSWGTAAAINTDTLFAKVGESYVYPDPTTVCEAYAIMLHKSMQRYPDAQFYCLGMLTRQTISTSLTEHNAELEAVAELMGIPFVELESITLAPEDYSLSMGNNLHPKAEGMDRIAQRVINAMLGNEDHKELDVYDITSNLSAVTSDNEAKLAYEGGKYETTLRVANGYVVNATVSMGGTDVTRDCVADGKVTIENVTGDIVITANAVEEGEDASPSGYRWDYDSASNSLVNVVTEGYSTNKITKTAGSISAGKHSGTIHALDVPVILKPDKAWYIEWSASGDDGEYMLLASDTDSKKDGAQYLYIRKNGNFIGFGTRTGSTYKNYGVTELGDLSERHDYRIENRVAEDGSNMSYLLVDGEEVGALNTLNNNGSNTTTTDNWLSGKTLTFSYLGSDSHKMSAVTLDHLKIHEGMAEGHVHNYAITSSKESSCQEAGYDVYTCSCGLSYTVTHEKTNHNHGPSIAIDGVLHYTCQDCGAEETKEMVNYRWELNAAKDNLVSVETDGNTKNELTRVTEGAVANGTVSNGTFTNVSYAVATPVELLPTDEWVIEWKASSGSQWMLLWDSVGSGMDAPYLFHYPNGNNDAWFLGYYSGNYKNYGVDGLDTNTLHTYRIVNEVNVDGSNMPYLYVDGEKVGPMNEFYNVVSATNTTEDWLDGQKLSFDHLGRTNNTNHALNAYLEYVQIYTKGADEHTHDFSMWDEKNGVLSRECSVCGKVETRELLNYRWELNAAKDGLVSVTTDGFTGNDLSAVTAGTVSNGVFNGSIFAMEEAVTLDPTVEWIIEWSGYVTGNCKLLANGSTSRTKETPYIFQVKDVGVFFGYYNGSLFENFGALGVANSQQHTYRIVNKVNADGTNMPYLYVDGVEAGPMNAHYESLTNKNVTEDWVSGQTMTFDHLGRTSHPLKMYLEYLEIYVNGTSHSHEYTEWTESNGILSRECTICGESETKEMVNYRWELNEAKDGLENVTANGNSKNALSVVSAGTVSEGTFSGTSYKMGTAITLEPTDEWIIEWKGNSSSEWMLLYNSVGSGEDAPYLYHNPSHKAFFLGYNNGSWRNHGVDGLDSAALHTYRIVNVINEDGTNMPHLYQDGVDMGPMNDYYVSTSSQNTTNNWLSGKTLTFDRLGRSGSHALNCYLEYVQVYTKGTGTHEHTFGDWFVVNGKLERECTGCGEKQTKEMVNYRWELNEAKNGLETVTVNDNSENALSVVSAGTVTDGTFKGTAYQLETPVTLLPTEAWVIEWRGNSSSEWMLLYNSKGSGEDAPYLYHNPSHKAFFLGYNNGSWRNHGVDGLDSAALHTYRIVNVINEDGTNMPHLYQDGVDMGPMNDYYVGTSSQNTTNDWLSGKTLTFDRLGRSGNHALNCYLEYVQIYTMGEGEHKHVFGPWSQTANGDLERSCTSCGEVETQEVNVYHWELNESKDALVNVTADGSDPNALTVVKAGTVSEGTFNKTSYAVAETIVLEAQNDWAIEWRAKSGSEWMLLYNSKGSGEDAPYLYHNPTHKAFFIGCSNGGYKNYGVDGLDTANLHTYRIVNEVNADGSNMPYLYVDGVKAGPMNDYYVSTTAQNTTNDWLNGRDLTFDHIGSTANNNHALNAYLEYVKIWEKGISAHTHEFKKTGESAGNCSEHGYVTYTCECGYFYNESTGELGDHVYGEWYVCDNQKRRDCQFCDEAYETGTLYSVRWELNDKRNGMVSVSDEDNTKNVLSQITGSVTDGLMSGAVFGMNEPITLKHDTEWVIEWKAAGDTDQYMVLSGAENASAEGTQYIYSRPNGEFLGFGIRTEGVYFNYGAINLEDRSQEHVYRIENRVAEDGSNMPWLVIDDVEIAPLNHYNYNGSNQGRTSDALNGMDLVFGYLGSRSHTLRGVTLEYVQIWTNGLSEEDHKHTCKVVSSTRGDCQTLIENTYACDCGHKYAAATEEYGPHAYSDWAIVGEYRQHTCSICHETERVKMGIEYDESASGNYYNVLSQKDFVLCDGVKEYEIILNNDDGTRRQVMHVLEVDTFNKNVEILPSYYGIDKDLTNPENWSAHIMEEQMDYYRDELGYNVVAGMNTSLNYNKDAPTSFLVYNGEVLADRGTIYNDNCPTYLAVIKNEDGTVRCEVRASANGLQGDEWHAVGCNFGFILKDGVMVDTSGSRDGTADRSMVGVKADGSLVLVQAEGRNAPYACGLSAYELCETMLAMGCKWAINGDGGGSSQILTKREGEDDYQVRNICSDGTPRATLAGVIIASKNVADGVFNHVSLVAEDAYITPTGSTNVEIKGVDASGAPAEMPEGITYTATGGTFADGVFTSDGTVGTQTVTAFLGGEEVGLVEIEVVVPDRFVFDNEIIAIPYGKTANINLTGYYGTLELKLTADDLEFDLSEAIAAINGLEITAIGEDEAGGIKTAKLTATLVYGESFSATVEVTIGKGSEIIYDFEDQNLHSWYRSTATEYNSTQVGGITYLADASTGHVRNGDYSMAVELDYSNALTNGFYLGTFRTSETVILKNALTIGMWVYFPDEADAMRIDVQVPVYAGEDDPTFVRWLTPTPGISEGGETNITEVGFINAYDESGWHYLTIDVSSAEFVGMPILKCYVSLKDGKNGYSYGNQIGVTGNYVLYVDDITVDYSEVVDDRETPVFGDMTYDTGTGIPVILNGNTVSAHTLTFAASVAENTGKNNYTGIDTTSARAYVDGVDHTDSLTWSEAGDQMMLKNVTLPSGMHTIKFSVCDKAGNYGSVIRSIVVDSADSAKVKVVPHDPDADRILLGSLYYIDVVADDPETISSVTAVLDLNNISVWQLDHMDVAEGFEASYTLIEDEDIATVVITGDGTTKLSGENQVLVSIPMRTWELPVTEPIYEREEVWMYDQYKAVDCVFGMDLKVEIDAIHVSYHNETFVSYTGETIQVDTEMSGIGATSSGSAANVYIGDEPWYADWNGGHDHRAETKEYYLEGSTNHVDAVALTDKAATCTEEGYTGRTYCEVCESVVDWGESIAQTGHSYSFVGGVLTCGACGDLFTGVYTDGKIYVDGVVSGGWSGDSYYAGGEMLTGVHKVPSPEDPSVKYYYDFGEDGVCEGRTAYTGIFKDGDVYRYSYIGELASGWQVVDESWYYFSPQTMAGVSGTNKINGLEFEFEENGKLVSGVWVVTEAGRRYWYGPNYYWEFWYDIDGETYYFDKGYAVTGVNYVRKAGFGDTYAWTEFSETGAFVRYLEGFITDSEGNLFYAVEGVNLTGLHKIDGDYYFFRYTTGAVTGECYAYETHCDLPCDNYEFGEDYKMLQGFVEKSDGKYYYINGKTAPAGLRKIDGDYYAIRSSGKCATGEYSPYETYCDLPIGTYTFGEDGKMLNPPAVMVIRQVSENSATVYLKNAQAGTCIVAIYDASGQMLTSGMLNVGEKAGEKTISYPTFSFDGKYTAKAFLVDSSFVPLTECVAKEQ